MTLILIAQKDAAILLILSESSCVAFIAGLGGLSGDYTGFWLPLSSFHG